MERYDYHKNVKNDIKDYLRDEDIHWTKEEREDKEEQLQDDLWTEDSVTGNGSGSYTFSTWTAEENLCHNLDLLGEVLTEFGYQPDYMMEKGPEACDVAIRCYLLGECIGAAMDELEAEGWNDGYEEEEEEAEEANE